MLTLPVLLLLLVAVGGSAGMAGILGWLFHRLSRLEASGQDLERLLSDNAALREQIEAMRSDIEQLGERVDFSERLLEKGAPESDDHNSLS